MIANDVQYVADENGMVTAVIIPVDLWREIASERSTAYLLQSPEEQPEEAVQATLACPLIERQSV